MEVFSQIDKCLDLTINAILRTLPGASWIISLVDTKYGSACIVTLSLSETSNKVICTFGTTTKSTTKQYKILSLLFFSL